MKKILLRYKKRLITIAILLTIVQFMTIYLFNFQNKAPYFKIISDLNGCFSLFIAVSIPFLITRRAAKEGLLNKELQGWKLGLYISLLFVALSSLYFVLDSVIKLIFFGSAFAGLDVTVTILGSLAGALMVLFAGLCTGWVAQRIYTNTVRG